MFNESIAVAGHSIHTFFGIKKLKGKVGGGGGVQVDLVEESLKILKSLDLDVVLKREFTKKGFLGLRKIKLVCTMGWACSSLEDLEKLILGWMNVARLNMC
ncbi:pyruvate kinase isozyme A [Pyrus ussuriensis x Pyrus communis]|uniref:Pyruvate kinase isozyme A n=1 Tax=Pyrus ussuriensis x Pyrus communis TaxID=2448454 RepID=A0A5N5FA65_9ROSA|nr:pyruvate kinase isozyme A [Pyrus ussuriensis x Pyrus communis]